jgi:apolipoprotein D and lipocalin family protein
MRPAHTSNRLGAAVLVLLPALVPAAGGAGVPAAAPPATEDHVDISRYAGTWYEIAKIPNRFQRQCARDTTAEYALRSDGRLDVINRCRNSSGGLEEARGIARIVDTSSNAKLKVSFVSLFGWRLFWGDYWIMKLGPGYAWSLVGTPDRRYGWILSRTPAMSERARETVDDQLRQLGYDPQDFENLPQNARD